MDPLFEISALRKTFSSGGWLGIQSDRKTVALDAIDLEIPEGCSLGIVGESGSGKSTLARIIAGLENRDSGVLNYRGRAIDDWLCKDRKAYLRDIQFVFQDPLSSLNPRRTIRKSLLAPLEALSTLNFADRQKRLETVLEETQLKESFLDRYPHEFSGGQAQRIAIARALMLEPKVLILDEPVSALDVSIQAEILKLLQRLRKEHGLTYLFISHDLAVVKEVCSDIVVLHDGKLVEQNPCDELLQSPKQAYTRMLVSSAYSFK